MIKRVIVLYLYKINDRTMIGASFCQVDRIKHDSHEIDIITEGYHKWHGTNPSFSIIAENRIKCIILLGIDILNQRDILLIRRILDPRACARKYLTAASVSWNFFLFIKSGINLSILSSMAIHKNIQFLADTAIKDLEIITIEAKKDIPLI